ncbi:MAG: hypothetical protein J6X47_08190, partial [Clostridia bacterium]|nr:hypothetical protein [Clostridia bacterium]
RRRVYEKRKCLYLGRNAGSVLRRFFYTTGMPPVCGESLQRATFLSNHGGPQRFHRESKKKEIASLQGVRYNLPNTVHTLFLNPFEMHSR